MEKELFHQILDSVNMWLHFIEAKNAALIAFNIALLTALMSSFQLGFGIILFSFIIVGLLISTILLLISFTPINKTLSKVNGTDIKPNLLHYAYIASLETNDYLEKLYDTYGGSLNKKENDDCAIEKEYAEEIVQNSRITIKKQTYFKKALYIDIILIFAIIALVICA